MFDHVSLNQKLISTSLIRNSLNRSVGTATLNRDLAELVGSDALLRDCHGRATSYRVSSTYKLHAPVEPDTYSSKPIDTTIRKCSYPHDEYANDQRVCR